MTLAEWQLDLRAAGYDGDFDEGSLREAVMMLGWENPAVSPMPEKRDPDWPLFAARAARGTDRVSVGGKDAGEALGVLLLRILTLKV